MSGKSMLKNYLQERNKALVELDEAYVAKIWPGAKPEIRLLILHKTRYSCTDIDPELRHESGRWLRQHGFGAFDGALLPEGELPL